MTGREWKQDANNARCELPRPSKGSATGAGATSASSSAPPSRGRESSSSAATCRAVREFRPLVGQPHRDAAADGAAAAARRAVEMVEHVMAALAGMHVDNCEVWVDQPEMPGCDGSAKAFVEAIAAGGHRRAGRPRELFVVREVVRLGDEDCWIEARPAAGGKTIIHYDLDYGSGNPIGRQSLEVTLRPAFLPVQPGPQPHVHAAARGGRIAGPRHGHSGPRSTTC